MMVNIKKREKGFTKKGEGATDPPGPSFRSASENKYLIKASMASRNIVL